MRTHLITVQSSRIAQIATVMTELTIIDGAVVVTVSSSSTVAEAVECCRINSSSRFELKYDY